MTLLTQPTQWAGRLAIFKLTTFGANPRRTGLLAGCKPKAFWTIAHSFLTRKLTCEPL
jgi:hypothetical protein